MCEEVRGEKTSILQQVLNKYYNLEKSPEVTKSLAEQSHKTLISILCMILEDGVSLGECLELADLRPVYELYSGRIVGLV